MNSTFEPNANNIGIESEGDNRIKEKPSILALPNEPYYLLNDMEPKIVENLLNSEGKQFSTIIGIALCRCGAWKNKPFCDGTHASVGFLSESRDSENDHSEKRDVIENKRKSYVGKKITVHDNRRICSHAAECIKNLPSVFKLNARPWIDADGANSEDMVNTIRKCPSGALSYSFDDFEHRDPNERAHIVTLSKDGPYIWRGSLKRGLYSLPLWR